MNGDGRLVRLWKDVLVTTCLFDVETQMNVACAEANELRIGPARTNVLIRRSKGRQGQIMGYSSDGGLSRRGCRLEQSLFRRHSSLDCVAV